MRYYCIASSQFRGFQTVASIAHPYIVYADTHIQNRQVTYALMAVCMSYGRKALSGCGCSIADDDSHFIA